MEGLSELLRDNEPFSGEELSRWRRFSDRSGKLGNTRSDHNAMLLALIGLKPLAFDLDILERLLDMNRSAGL